MDEAIFLEGDYSFNSGFKAGDLIAEMETRPTAVFCYNDDMAIGLHKYFVQNQLEGIGIMGFDGSIMTEYMTPGITTVKRPIKLIAEKAIELLLSSIESEDEEELIFVYDQVIIERDSI